MTRFKELKRIQEAIAHATDLPWALGYCRTRIQMAVRKDHLEHWKKLKEQVRKAMEESN